MCDLPMGRSTKNVRTQFWDVRQFWWKWADTVQMLHIVDMPQMFRMLLMLHMVEMLQMFHMVAMHLMLYMVDTSWW